MWFVLLNLIFSLLCTVLLIIVCPFVFFRLALSVLLQITVFDYLCGIFKLFVLKKTQKHSKINPKNNECLLSLNCHLSHWTWNKGYHRYNKVCFIHWSSLQNWQWGLVKNETSRQRRWFQLSYCELSIYI